MQRTEKKPALYLCLKIVPEGRKGVQKILLNFFLSLVVFVLFLTLKNRTKTNTLYFCTISEYSSYYMAFVQLLDFNNTQHFLEIGYPHFSPLCTALRCAQCNHAAFVMLLMRRHVLTSTEYLLYLAKSHVISDIPVADTCSTPKKTCY